MSLKVKKRMQRRKRTRGAGRARWTEEETGEETQKRPNKQITCKCRGVV